MAYEYTLTTVIPASAREIYDAWLDSVAHSRMTGGQATTSPEPGAEFTAWDGYITGRNLELDPGKRIVQAWRTTKFPEDHDDSIITLTFEERDGGTLMTLSHSNVPEEHLGYEQGGWQKSYFEPMIAYFSNASATAEEELPSTQVSNAAAKQLKSRRPAAGRRARARRPAARKTAVTPKARSRSAAAKNRKRATNRRPKTTSARKTAGTKKKAVAQKAQRKRTITKAKSARTRARTKAKVRVRERARSARIARHRSAGARSRRR
jgi:uncharacterized protein YndB with AHSA1/START domain